MSGGGNRIKIYNPSKLPYLTPGMQNYRQTDPGFCIKHKQAQARPNQNSTRELRPTPKTSNKAADLLQRAVEHRAPKTAAAKT